MAHHALVFLRANGAEGLGHVGWAFTCSAGDFCVGAVENSRRKTVTRRGEADVVAWASADPVQYFRNCPAPYDQYKVVPLDQPCNPQAAEAKVEEVRTWPYMLFSKNCMDATYEVLTAFAGQVLPRPAGFQILPTLWFAQLPGKVYDVSTPFYWQGHPLVLFLLAQVVRYEAMAGAAIVGFMFEPELARSFQLQLDHCASIHAAATAQDWSRVVAEARAFFKTYGEL